MNVKSKFQTKNYKFPKKMYCLYLSVEIPNVGKKAWFVTQHPVKSAKEAREVIEQFNFEAQFKKLEFRSIQNSVLLTIHLDKLFPLTKEMWNKTTFAYQPQQRINDFYECIKKPDLYEILVVPGIYVDKKEFDILMPMRQSTPDADITELMKVLDHPVDPKATHAGIYKLGKLEILNEENKLMPIEAKTMNL